MFIQVHVVALILVLPTIPSNALYTLNTHEADWSQESRWVGTVRPVPPPP